MGSKTNSKWVYAMRSNKLQQRYILSLTSMTRVPASMPTPPPLFCATLPKMEEFRMETWAGVMLRSDPHCWLILNCSTPIIRPPPACSVGMEGVGGSEEGRWGLEYLNYMQNARSTQL